MVTLPNVSFLLILSHRLEFQPDDQFHPSCFVIAALSSSHQPSLGRGDGRWATVFSYDFFRRGSTHLLSIVVLLFCQKKFTTDTKKSTFPIAAADTKKS